eukprot:154028-Amphidinium_carterae.1
MYQSGRSSYEFGNDAGVEDYHVRVFQEVLGRQSNGEQELGHEHWITTSLLQAHDGTEGASVAV